MAKTKLKKYLPEHDDVTPVTSDRTIRFSSASELGDELVWCGDVAGNNPDVVINAHRGVIGSVVVGGRRIR